jgi:ABC-type multidrug transport system ATPase subunit
MEKYRFVFPYKLSGGQKQRVAIGSTLALRPQVLILDEPTSELDPIGRKEVFTLIKDLKEKSALAIVVVEHHTEELAIYCDRVWLMNRGEIILQDTVVNFFGRTDLLRENGVRPPDGVEFMAELSAAGVFDAPPGLLREEDIVNYLSTVCGAKVRRG